MIDIKKNSINKISIDIDQYEYYLIEFTSDSNCESVTAIFSNSGFNCDYPIIQIEETVTANVNVLLGKINLPYLGFWSANIYGNIDGVNLDTGLATFLIEEDVRVYRGVQEEEVEVDNNNYLIAGNNLSDIDDVTTSQNNLNVYDRSVVNDLANRKLIKRTEIASFNSGTGLIKEIIYYDSAIAGVCTVEAGMIEVGDWVTFIQDDTAGVSFTNGAGVDTIINTGILATTAIGDIRVLLRMSDSGTGERYVII